MIVYTVSGEVGKAKYLDIKNSKDLSGKSLYINMTNKCPCNCVFCLRNTKEQLEGNNLWLKGGEPSVEDVLAVLSDYNLDNTPEIVFCGFGEPLERLYDICKLVDKLKETYPKLRFRVNTNGLANLIYGKDITPELAGRFDTVSISLNAPDAEEYLALTQSKFGIESFDSLKDFAKKAKAYVPNVVLTVVDKVMPPDKIKLCQSICDDLGVTLRVRAYEE